MPTESGDLPGYIQKETGEWIVVSENKRSARFHNPGNVPVLKIKVDGGLITSGERADYVLAHPTVDVIVELKGSDVTKAIHQIRATRYHWLNCAHAGEHHAALVVRGKGIHPKEQTNYERWKREFRKTFKMKLRIESSNRDYEFGEFLLPEASRD
jgi:hypothetical protein